MTITLKNQSGPLSARITRRAGLAALLASAVALVTFAAPSSAYAEDKKAVKVGIISGEDEDVWRVVTAEAAKSGLIIQTVVFNDYTQPNEALERGERRVRAVLEKLRVREVQVPPSCAEALRTINTPEDYKKALAGREGGAP